MIHLELIRQREYQKNKVKVHTGDPTTR
jgi:hypothetical protein